MDAIRIIRQKYKGFSKVNKKIANYILKDPTLVLSLTANEIASNSETSPASVTRFSKSLGFDSWEEMKLSIATKKGAEQTPTMIDPIVSSDDSIEMVCAKVESLLNSTVADLFSLIDKNDLTQSIEKIKKAETIYLMGIGSSSLTAYDLYHKFNRAGKRAVFNYDVHMQFEFLNYSTQKDVLIAISYSGHSKEVLIACEIAKQNSTPVVFITRNSSERITELGDIILLVPENEHLLRVGAIASIASTMAVGDVLYLGSIQDELDTVVEKNMINTRKLVEKLKEK
ncbi:MurR/RpiR family transcriptional regulator [Enterococcus rivorum]|uniref:RpiR family transcriptional regulator n=1 Tax=Enterococcus rivorum TaxID=762845 RepID=A0A1E5KYW2_9ENTE|nr:MurR/RpiR family transcriptional regulator [Enterococcus rivorum]MBP2097556.1 DNA-binding MurR/RpiR family transcriptional regulator [Enterococcus rivorum]OEH83008.1 RpiR family transcriptional regulator [Enterococcus rivorum]